MATAAENSRFDQWRALVAHWRRHPKYRSFRRQFRALKRAIPNVWRSATYRYRLLPSAVIVGAQKAGTTQLYSCMIRHPQCFGGAAKEIQYFSKRSHLPLRWYQARFPLTRTVARVNGLCLEATPSYLPNPAALRMMAGVLPQAKIIVLLRDPVSRAFSHYQHRKTRQLESRPFSEVISRAMKRRPCRPTLGSARRSDAEPMLDYISRGYYALQLDVLFDAYAREQVLILDSAELFHNTNAACQQVFDFLGLKRHDVTPKKIHNRGYYREQIDPASAQLLREHYRPYDELLVEFLGRRFRWMDKTVQSPSGKRSAA